MFGSILLYNQSNNGATGAQCIILNRLRSECPSFVVQDVDNGVQHLDDSLRIHASH